MFWKVPETPKSDYPTRTRIQSDDSINVDKKSYVDGKQTYTPKSLYL